MILIVYKNSHRLTGLLVWAHQSKITDIGLMGKQDTLKVLFFIVTIQISFLQGVSGQFTFFSFTKTAFFTFIELS